MSTDPATDEHRIALLARASHSITVTPLDLAGVLETAKIRRHRRHRRRGALGALLAVTLLVGAISGVGPEPASRRAVDPADTPDSAAARPFPAPPAGMVWVGQNALVVAVPRAWPVTESPCGSGAPAEVVDGTGAFAVDCAQPAAPRTRLTITPVVVTAEASTGRSCRQVSARRVCSGHATYPDEGVAIQVGATGPNASSQVDRILDSAMVLPPGWTTVPFAWGASIRQRLAVLEGAGFVVDRLGATPSPSAEVAVGPEPGSVVEQGATLTLTVTPPPRADPEPGNDHAALPPPPLREDPEHPVGPVLERLARRFVAYAVGASDTFPHAGSISIAFRGERVASLDHLAAALPDRGIWRVCRPGSGRYAASSCPLSVLSPVRNAAVNGYSLISSADAGDVVCAPPRSGPPPRGPLVVLRVEPGARSCASDFALVLAADDRGRLRALDLTLSEP